MISRRLLRIKTVHLLYAYFHSDQENLNRVEKELNHSINKTFELYHYLMLIPGEIIRLADNKIEVARKKYIKSAQDENPNTRFVDNLFWDQILKNRPLQRYLNEHKMSWVNFPEVIRSIYNDVMASRAYKKYMECPHSNYEIDKRYIIYLFKSDIATNSILRDSLEEQSIYWNDEFEFVLSMIIETFTAFKQSQGDIAQLKPKFRSREDESFAAELLRLTVEHHAANMELVKEYLQNWEVERVADMDKTILEMALTELMYFPQIPVRVTLDEYIDLSKYYSTDRSSNFINGVLDKAVSQLTAQGKIKKMGKGLLNSKK